MSVNSFLPALYPGSGGCRSPIPSSTLLDLGYVQMEQVVQPCQQFLSAIQLSQYISVLSPKTIDNKEGVSNLDSPMVGVLIANVRIAGDERG